MDLQEQKFVARLQFWKGRLRQKNVENKKKGRNVPEKIYIENFVPVIKTFPGNALDTNSGVVQEHGHLDIGKHTRKGIGKGGELGKSP